MGWLHVASHCASKQRVVLMRHSLHIQYICVGNIHVDIVTMCFLMSILIGLRVGKWLPWWRNTWLPDCFGESEDDASGRPRSRGRDPARGNATVRVEYIVVHWQHTVTCIPQQWIQTVNSYKQIILVYSSNRDNVVKDHAASSFSSML